MGYWGLDLHEQPHRKICDLIQEAEFDDEKPYVQIVVPRYSYKTSIVRGGLVWKQLRQIHLHHNVYHRIMLASAKLALSRESLDVILEQLRNNQKIIHDFGEMVRDYAPGQKASKKGDSIILAPRLDAGENPTAVGGNFWVASQRRMGVGAHADEAFIDDLNDEENSGTPFQRERVKKFYRLIYPLIGMHDRLGRRTRITMTATMYHEDDARGMIQREEAELAAEKADYKSPWRFIQQGCYNEDGSAFFPAKFPLETLQLLQQKMGVKDFAHQFLNEPSSDEGLADEEQIRFIPRSTMPPLKDGRIGVDPNHHSDGKALGCFAAVSVVGYDRFAKMYVQDARGSRDWDAGDLIECLFDLHELYPDYPIYIEDSHMAGFRQALAYEEAERSRKDNRRVHLPVFYIPADVRSTKQYRWTNLGARCRMGTIYFAEDITPTLKLELKNELVKGANARFVDYLDSLAIADTGVRPRFTPTGEFMETPAKRQANVITFDDFFPESREWVTQ